MIQNGEADNMDKLIELGLQKRHGQLNITWDELGAKFGVSGEICRNRVLKHLKRKGELQGIYNKSTSKILFISDQHFPYNLPKEVLKDYVNKVDILIFGGDETDAQSLSNFSKKYRVPFIDEMVGARQMIMDMIDYINPKSVYFIKGNHNVRFIRYLSDKLTDDLLQLMPETNLDLIINNGFFKYDHMNKTKTYFEPLREIYATKNINLIYDGDWYLQLGDTIFSHPKAFKTGALQTSEKAYLYFLQLGKQFECLVTAHTHASALGRHGKCVIYESGCLCESAEYNQDGLLSKPHSQGFVYLVQKDNHFNYDLSKLILL